MQPDTADMTISDEVLVRQCQNGDNEAVEKLIIKYKDRLHNVIYRICANYEDAAELTQDAFVKIIENIYKFKGHSSFYTWAFRIVVNLTLNHCRRKKITETQSLDNIIGSGDPQDKATLKSYLVDSDAVDPAQVAQSRENIKLIIKAVNSLDEDHRTVVVLRDIENMNYSQIAQVLEIEMGTVKSRIARARAILRRNLEAMVK